MKTIVFSCGDINGIGPEIIVKSIKKLQDKLNIVLPIPIDVFEATLDFTGIKLSYQLFRAEKPLTSGLSIIDIKSKGISPGTPTPESGRISFESIKTAFKLVQSGVADAIVTAPISKKALGLAGINFPGHTEMFQQWCGVEYPLMTFLSDNLKCALVTIHIPVSDISSSLTTEKLQFITENFLYSLKNDLGIVKPRVAILGLNPHAGEEGRIGKEETEIIAPLIETFEDDNIIGPLVPDAFFGNGSYKLFDAYIAMYHDQGLIPFKLLNFNKGVNFTAGLPIVRTSPDHGTAFDIAWKGKADESSFFEAVKWAEIIVSNRRLNG